MNPKVIILSGGPNSVHVEGSPRVPEGFFEYCEANSIPVLGICYGMQMITHLLGGEVKPATHGGEYGRMPIDITTGSKLFGYTQQRTINVWMSHGDEAVKLPEGFTAVAQSHQVCERERGPGQRRPLALGRVWHVPCVLPPCMHARVAACRVHPQRRGAHALGSEQRLRPNALGSAAWHGRWPGPFTWHGRPPCAPAQGAIVGIENPTRQIYGFQFHPEVMHTETGIDMIRHFLLAISGMKPDWNMGQVVEEQLQKIAELVRVRRGAQPACAWRMQRMPRACYT